MKNIKYQKSKILNIALVSWFLIFTCWFSSFGQDNPPISKSAGQDKISLDIKGMEITDVLKMLATRSDMNIVVGKNVTGRVTLFLKDVDLWEAFEIILLANDLAYEKQANIVNVMTQRDYELLYGERYKDKKIAKVVQLKYAKAIDLSRALNQIKTNIGKIVTDEASNTVILMDTQVAVKAMAEFISQADLPIQTKVFNLNYAQADKLLPKLQEIVTKGVGSVRIDERTNKVVVSDFPEKLKDITNVISAFDEKTQQVLIDAQIIEVKPSDKFEMGVDWDYWIKKNFRLAASMPTVGAINKLSVGTAAAALNVTNEGKYKGIIDLLRTIGDTKILSSPRIMVLNNQEAKILVGTKDAYITSTNSQTGDVVVTSQTVNFVDVGMKLYVTPTINNDGFVTMKIKPEISSAEAKELISQDKKTEVPIVTTSEAETTIMVKDGITIIIGGLKKDERKKTVKKIPGIGDIPLIGFLFRNTYDNVEKTDLVILLTPHIVSGEDSITDFSQVKPKDGIVAEMIDGTIIKNKIDPGMHQDYLLKMHLDYNKLLLGKIRTLALLDNPKGEKGNIKLAFTLIKDGNLIAEPYIIETNNPKLTLAALKAIKSAAPFPAFPKSFNKDKETFKINLDYQ